MSLWDMLSGKLSRWNAMRAETRRHVVDGINLYYRDFRCDK